MLRLDHIPLCHFTTEEVARLIYSFFVFRIVRIALGVWVVCSSIHFVNLRAEMRAAKLSVVFPHFLESTFKLDLLDGW